MSDEAVTFQASFPAIQSAIKVDGAGGARIQLDIPETEMPAIARLLLLLRGQVLTVTVEVQESSIRGSSKATTRAARRPTDVAGG